MTRTTTDTTTGPASAAPVTTAAPTATTAAGHHPAPSDAATSRRGEEGAAMIEMAFAFTIFFAVLWGIITYGALFAVDHTLSAAAAEGARAAVGTRTEAAAVEAAQAAALHQLDALGANAAHAVVQPPTVGPCAAPVGATCITVSVAYPWESNPVVPVLIPGATPSTLSSVSTIQLSE